MLQILQLSIRSGAHKLFDQDQRVTATPNRHHGNLPVIKRFLLSYSKMQYSNTLDYWRTNNNASEIVTGHHFFFFNFYSFFLFQVNF